MGVKGLWSLVEPSATNVRLESLAGRRMAVDASIWLFQFCKAMRDREGNQVRGAHVVGFFRRICKLLFYGILPIFVFDGATPTLKRQTVLNRRKRRTQATDSVQKTAERLLMARMQLHAIDAVHANPTTVTPHQQRNNDDIAGAQYMADTIISMPTKKTKRSSATVFEEEESTTPKRLKSKPNTPSKPIVVAKKQAPTQDEYILPPSKPNIESTIVLSNDPRLADEREIRDFISEHQSSVDLNSLNLDSSSFSALAPEVQYQIILDLKTKSREASFSRVAELVCAPTAIDFSLLQIRNLVHRNALTEKLFDIAKTGGITNNPGLAAISNRNARKRLEARQKAILEGPKRIASMKGRSYVLTKNNDAAGTGHTMEWIQEKTGKIVENGKISSQLSEFIQRQRGLALLCKTGHVVGDKGDERMTIGDDDTDDDEEVFENVILDSSVMASLLNADDGAIGLDDDVFSSSDFPGNPPECRGDLSPLFDPDDDDGVFNDWQPIGQTSSIPEINADKMSDMAKKTSDPESLDDEVVYQLMRESENQQLFNRPDGPSDILSAPHSITMCEIDVSGLSAAPESPAEESLLGVVDHNFYTPPKCNISNLQLGEYWCSKIPAELSCDSSVIEEINSLVIITEIDLLRDRLAHVERRRGKLKVGEGFSRAFLRTVFMEAVIRSCIFNLGSQDCSDTKGGGKIEGDIIYDACELSIAGKVGKENATDCPSADSLVNHPSRRFEMTEQLYRETAESGNQLAARQPQRSNEDTLDTVIETMSSMTPHQDAAVSNTAGRDKVLGEGTSLFVDEENHDAIAPFQNAHTKRTNTLVTTSIKDIATPLDLEPVSEGATMITDPYIEDSLGVEIEEHLEDTVSQGKELDDEEAASGRIDVAEAIEDEDDEFARFLNQIKDKSAKEVSDDLHNEMRILLGNGAKDRRDADTVTNEMIKDVQELLRILGIPYLIAPMEAESQCAWLWQAKLVEGIITDDSDVFLFGGGDRCDVHYSFNDYLGLVYKNVFNQNKYVEAYSLERLENTMGLKRKDLIRLAFLLGSDYTEGIPNVGVVSAMEVMKDFTENPIPTEERLTTDDPELLCLKRFAAWVKSLDTMPPKSALSTPFRKRFRRRGRLLNIPDGFPDQRVFQAYMDPQVDKNPQPFTFGSPDLTEIREFMQDKAFLSFAKTDEVLIPVIREMDRRRIEPTQTLLSNFFSANNGGKHQSVRVQNVVASLTGRSLPSSISKRGASSPKKARGRGRKK